MASVLWTNVRGTNTKLYAARVHSRSTNGDALGDHPRHRTHYWYQCPGRVPQALVPMSGPGQACRNTFGFVNNIYILIYRSSTKYNCRILKRIYKKYKRIIK